MNLDNYYKHKQSPDGFHTYCKGCNIKYSSAWQFAHPEERSVRFRKWYLDNKDYVIAEKNKTHAEDAEKYSAYMWWYRRLFKDKVNEYSRNKVKHNITNKEWNFCKEYFNNTCAYCGISNEEAKRKYKQYLHKDHVDSNGENDLSNCVPACKNCNGKKWAFNMRDWFEKQDFFSEEKYQKILKWINEDYIKF